MKAPRGGGIPSSFGTGEETKPARPWLGRIFLEGMALGAGFMAIRGIVMLVKKSWDDRDVAPDRLDVEDED